MDSARYQPLATMLLAAVALFATSQAGAQTPSGKVVEYYHSTLKHYFITANPDHQRIVDAGTAGKEWKRTGVSWGAYTRQNEASGLTPVCRFFVPGALSHFYTAIPSECEQVKTFPGLVYEGIDHYIEAPSAIGTCRNDQMAIYRTYNNGHVRNDANHRFTPDSAWLARAKSRGFSPEGAVMCAPVSAAEKEMDEIRLVKQATFGLTQKDLADVKRLGMVDWIESQYSATPSVFPVMDFVPTVRPDTCVDNSTPPLTKDSYCSRDNYSAYQVQRHFMRQAVHGEDQLRQRVAWALSQVLVTSAREVGLAYANRNYQQLLRDTAFSNFEQILLAITLSPMMGDYLDMANNRKTYSGIQPNENYAREIMQLFAVGTVMLNENGTEKKDAQGVSIPSYGQPEIMALTRALTGWTYPPRPGVASRWTNPRSYEGEMVSFADYHDTGEKILIGGVKLAANQTANDDLRAAVKAVFNHPNVGPFIAKQLIQKLVTGDPSPEYVERVTSVFNRDGLGQRGNMRSVIRAILLDREARGPYKVEPSFGKLKEPVLLTTSIIRGLGGSTDGQYIYNAVASMQQAPFAAPTVFNFYPPDFPVVGTPYIGPEFGLMDANLAITRLNFLESFVATEKIAAGSMFDATGTTIDLAPLRALASTPAAMVDKVAMMFGVTLSDSAKASVVKNVSTIAATDAAGRARMAAFLMISGPYGQIDR